MSAEHRTMATEWRGEPGAAPSPDVVRMRVITRCTRGRYQLTDVVITSSSRRATSRTFYSAEDLLAEVLPDGTPMVIGDLPPATRTGGQG